MFSWRVGSNPDFMTKNKCSIARGVLAEGCKFFRKGRAKFVRDYCKYLTDVLNTSFEVIRNRELVLPVVLVGASS